MKAQCLFDFLAARNCLRGGRGTLGACRVCCSHLLVVIVQQDYVILGQVSHTGNLLLHFIFKFNLQEIGGIHGVIIYVAGQLVIYIWKYLISKTFL